MSEKCDARTEVYSRVCGFFRPVQQWNRGKKEEYRQRTPYKIGAGGGPMEPEKSEAPGPPEGGWQPRGF